MRNLLETYYPGQPFEVVMDSLGERLDSGIFIYVGNEFSLDSLTLNQLLRFVERGNQAFIACSYIPQGLLDSLNDEACVSSDSYGEDSPVFNGSLYHVTDTVVSRTSSIHHWPTQCLPTQALVPAPTRYVRVDFLCQKNTSARSKPPSPRSASSTERTPIS
ncbi:MAG: hypothetical protein IPM82_16520 [Saprospiraceae bacterium]|nr:hypothetical protein [Saprospiraceae bacterium]